VYDTLAAASSEQGKLAEAVALYEKALAIRTKTPAAAAAAGAEVVGQNCVNIGMLLGTQGRHDSACVMFRKALAVFRKASVNVLPIVA
jgi:tetratricopeptide (TPR) repeat protein